MIATFPCLHVAGVWWLAFVITPFAIASGGLNRVPLADGVGTVAMPDNRQIWFLRFGAHSYEPTRVSTTDGREVVVERGESIVIAPFQDLRAVSWRFPDAVPGSTLRVERPVKRDAFWEQVIMVDQSWIDAAPKYQVVETGTFGAALPENVRSLLTRPVNWATQEASLNDPIIPAGLDHEMPWRDLAAAALPLDFQKVMLASPHDPSPAFAFQNGQWLTTWPAHDLPGVAKEDHWFAPALLIDGQLIRPAPLSAHPSWRHTDDGRTLPIWTLEWTYREIVVREELFSLQRTGIEPQLFARFEIRHAPPGVQLAIGLGRRPNVHY